jgi:hypothetical protein
MPIVAQQNNHNQTDKHKQNDVTKLRGNKNEKQ